MSATSLYHPSVRAVRVVVQRAAGERQHKPVPNSIPLAERRKARLEAHAAAMRQRYFGATLRRFRATFQPRTPDGRRWA